MKKYIIFLIFFSFIISIMFVPETNSYDENDCLKEIKLTDINVLYLNEYIKKNNYSRIAKICTEDYCQELKRQNMISSINLFKQEYVDYLKYKKGEEASIEANLKGFKIAAIYLDTCH